MAVSQGKTIPQNGQKKILAALLILFPMLVFALTPIYNFTGPALFGVTFFYWFATLWLVISALMFFGAAHLLNSMEGDE